MTDPVPEIPRHVLSAAGRLEEVVFSIPSWSNPEVLDKIADVFHLFEQEGIGVGQVRCTILTCPYLRLVAKDYIEIDRAENNYGRLWGALLVLDNDVPPATLVIKAKP